jgi:hypothetical protein
MDLGKLKLPVGQAGELDRDPVKELEKAERLKSDSHNLIRAIPAKGNCLAGLSCRSFVPS